MVFTFPPTAPQSSIAKKTKIETLENENFELKQIINDLNNKINKSSKSNIIKKLQKDYETIINHRSALHKQLDDYVDTIDYQNKEITMLANQRDSAIKEIDFYKKQIKLLKSDKKYDDELVKKINYFKNQVKQLKTENNNLQFENATNKNYENLYNTLKSELETTVFELDEKKLDNEEQKIMISNLTIYNNTLQNKLNDTIDKNIDLTVENDTINTKYNNIANECIEMDKFIQTQDKTLTEQKKTNDKLLQSQSKIEEELQFKLDEYELQFKLEQLEQEQEQEQEQEEEQEQEQEELESKSTYLYPREDFYVIDIEKELDN